MDAAITFHHVHGDTNAIVPLQDYNGALDIAASALSRLIPLFGLDDAGQARVLVSVDLTRQHFARGATALRSANGTHAMRLFVRRADLRAALGVVKRSGIVFTFPSTPGAD